MRQCDGAKLFAAAAARRGWGGVGRDGLSPVNPKTGRNGEADDCGGPAVVALTCCRKTTCGKSSRPRNRLCFTTWAADLVKGRMCGKSLMQKELGCSHAVLGSRLAKVVVKGEGGFQGSALGAGRRGRKVRGSGGQKASDRILSFILHPSSFILRPSSLLWRRTCCRARGLLQRARVPLGECQSVAKVADFRAAGVAKRGRVTR